MLHYTLDNYMKHTETSEASIYDKLEYEKQSVGLESVWKESIVDLITNMMELQKQEEDEFRTSVHAKVSAQKKRPIPGNIEVIFFCIRCWTNGLRFIHE